MLVVQGYVLGDVALGDEATDPGPAGLENLATHRYSFDFRLLANKGLVNKSFPRAGLLAYPQPACFDDLLSDLKLLREQSQLGIIS